MVYVSTMGIPASSIILLATRFSISRMGSVRHSWRFGLYLQPAHAYAYERFRACCWCSLDSSMHVFMFCLYRQPQVINVRDMHNDVEGVTLTLPMLTKCHATKGSCWLLARAHSLLEAAAAAGDQASLSACPHTCEC